MSPSLTWMLNLEVEHELAHGPGYIPSPAVLKRLEPFLPFANPLLGETDTAMTSSDATSEREALHAIQGTMGRCWSPTPAALLRLKKRGIACPTAPAFTALRKVNHRRFCLPLKGGAPEAHYIDTESELEQVLTRLHHQPWLFKRPFGAAGREQRKVGGGPLAKEDTPWLLASLRKGGMLAEHWVTIEQEYSLHGLLSPSGALTLGQICGQSVSPHRAWQTTVAPAMQPLNSGHSRELHTRAEQVAERLQAHNYFGPFGIDAYTYRVAAGPLRFNPLSELNARYCMGFAVGFEQIKNWRQLPGA